MDKSSIIPIQQTASKRPGWSIHLKTLRARTRIGCGFLDGASLEPRDDTAKATWIQDNSKVVTWIVNLVDPSITLSLQSFSTTIEVIILRW